MAICAERRLFSVEFGFDRGTPVDRYYIHAFLREHASDIRGHVLEVGDDAYTRQFGGDRIESVEILNRYPGQPQTTFVGDLTASEILPRQVFDCIIFTQTLQFIFDAAKAVSALHHALKPDGVLLISVPWVSPIDRGEWGGSWYWSFTVNALARLLKESFGPDRATVTSYGNVLSATAFLYGLAQHELSLGELSVNDPFCPVIVAGRAVRQGEATL